MNPISPKRLAEFRSHLIAKASAINTAKAYVKDIRHVYKVSGGEITRGTLAHYFARDVSDARKLRVATAWKAWVEFNADLETEVPKSVYSPKRVKKKIKESLEPEEYDRVIDEALTMGRRGKSALLLALSGARRSSIANLRVGDVITRKGKRYLKLQSKGSDEHVVPLDGRLAELVDEVIAGRKTSEPLIEGKRAGRPPSVNAVYRAVRALGERAGIEGRLHPHRLRHGFADWLRRKGVDLKVIQNILGHQNISTTQAYFRVSETDYDAVAGFMRDDLATEEATDED